MAIVDAGLNIAKNATPAAVPAMMECWILVTTAVLHLMPANPGKMATANI